MKASRWRPAEALAAGLPVVAARVGGQGEIAHPRLQLLPANASARMFAERLAALPIRGTLVRNASPRFPRVWSLSTSWRLPGPSRLDTLFVTANLNAGGAQRSLANLARELAGRHRSRSRCAARPRTRRSRRNSPQAGVDCFRASSTADPFEAAEGVLAQATARGARNLCFWNVDPKVKLLVAKFSPPGLRLVDASPGAYAYEELETRREPRASAGVRARATTTAASIAW